MKNYSRKVIIFTEGRHKKDREIIIFHINNAEEKFAMHSDKRNFGSPVERILPIRLSDEYARSQVTLTKDLDKSPIFTKDFLKRSDLKHAFVESKQHCMESNSSWMLVRWVKMTIISRNYFDDVVVRTIMTPVLY